MKKCIIHVLGYTVCIIVSTLLTFFLITKYIDNQITEIKEEKQYIQVSTEDVKEYRKNRYFKFLQTHIESIFVNQSKISKEAMCLAKNIYYEARGESFEDKIYVVNVTLNRTESNNHPDTICGTVFEPYQFSWTINYKGKSKKVDSDAWEESLKIAVWTIDNKDKLVDFTDGAVFYHANYVKPTWAKHKQKTVKTQAHIFYK